MEYLLLLLGFALLILSGRLLITGSVSIARRLRLSPFLIGLTVVAVGTSAPELLVSLTGAVRGHADIAVYNIVGSNISNVLLVLAVAVIILPIPVSGRTVWFDGSAMLVFSLVFWGMITDLELSALEGVLIFSLLIIFILASLYRSRRATRAVERSSTDSRETALPPVPGMKTWVAVLAVIAASGGLAIGADLLVKSAVSVARQIGLSERVISVTMIAVGTSIPELTTSAIAALRKETDISIGNIMGSNIFNIGLVLGLTSVVRPLNANPLILSFDVFWFAGASILLVILILMPPFLSLSRWKGLAMLSVYLIYLYLILK